MNKARLARLQSELKNPILIKKKENLLYLTGRSFMRGYLLVFPNRNSSNSSYPKRRVVDSSGVIFLGDGLEKVTGVKTDTLKNIAKYLGRSSRLQIEDEFTFAELEYLKKRCMDGSRPISTGRRIKITPVKSPVDRLREIKDAGEISCIKKSMQITAAVFVLVKTALARRKWSEQDLADYIVTAGKRLGAESVSFDPIVAAGANAATPHHIPGEKKLMPGEPIIMDFGFKYKGYCSDFTRTVFLKKAPKKLADAYNAVEKAYVSSMDFVGNSRDRSLQANEIYQKAVEVLAEKHLDKYFIHNLGHGTGLEIHEHPSLSAASKDILRPGMVFSIEPGVYLPGLGGIRIEDLVCLGKSGATKFINVPTDLKNNIIS